MMLKDRNKIVSRRNPEAAQKTCARNIACSSNNLKTNYFWRYPHKAYFISLFPITALLHGS